LLEVAEVFSAGFAEDEDVIEVYEYEGKVTEEGVLEALKDLGSIFEAKRHEVELKQWDDYHCFWDVVFVR
jgi:hypothetical protein